MYFPPAIKVMYMSIAELLTGHAAPHDEDSTISSAADVECAGASITDMLGNEIIFVVVLPCISLMFVCLFT